MSLAGVDFQNDQAFSRKKTRRSIIVPTYFRYTVPTRIAYSAHRVVVVNIHLILAVRRTLSISRINLIKFSGTTTKIYINSINICGTVCRHFNSMTPENWNDLVDFSTRHIIIILHCSNSDGRNVYTIYQCKYFTRYFWIFVVVVSVLLITHQVSIVSDPIRHGWTLNI